MLATTFAVIGMMIVPPPKGFDSREILDALREVETGGHKDPRNAVGDNGASIGPYQIGLPYWQDAVKNDSRLRAMGYQSVRDQQVAEDVIMAYMIRYAPNWQYETISRIHNGGPSGMKKKATIKYWNKVKKELNNEN